MTFEHRKMRSDKVRFSYRCLIYWNTLWLQDNVVEDNMSVDPKHHRYFVARRGQVLRDLADEYGGVMVSFPRTGSQSEKVTLKGAKECVEAAKKRMLEIVDDLVSRFFLFCCFSFPPLFCFWNVTIVPSFFPPTWTSSFSGCSSDHWVRDCSEVPPFHHGSQGLTHPADHQRSQCTDQVPRTWGPTR